MKVYYSIDEIPPIKNAVVTLGTFDGVHLGHQQVISFLKNSAASINGETVLFTFHPHPRIILHPKDHGMKLIQSIEDRIEKLANYGIDHLILFPFSVAFSRLSATEFVRDILVNKINVKLMTIGYNHHFGRNRSGNLEVLKELGIVYNFDVQEIPAFQESEVNISSTKIRNAISAGEIKKANSYLGKAFHFSGEIVYGKQLGTKIGFPTANISLNGEHQLIPKNGVYSITGVINNKTYKGMMNIGVRPTVSDTGESTIEVHLFDFNQQVYGETISIHVWDNVRDEQTFETIDALKVQLNNDKSTCLSLLDKLELNV